MEQSMKEQVTKEQFMVQRLLNDVSQLKVELTSLEYEYRLILQENYELKARLEECEKVEKEEDSNATDNKRGE